MLKKTGWRQCSPFLKQRQEQRLEDIRQTNQHGAEYWSARDLQPLLGYSQWRRFEQAIERAKVSCSQSGNLSENHFAGAGKMIELGKEYGQLELGTKYEPKSE